MLASFQAIASRSHAGTCLGALTGKCSCRPAAGVCRGRRLLLSPPLDLQLLEEGELWPGITKAEFAERRRRLAEALPADTVALLQAPPPTYVAGAVSAADLPMP